jgi:hypothetical protein
MRTTATVDVPRIDEPTIDRPGSARLVPAGHACHGLFAISKDFQDLLRAHCERCAAGTGSCLVARMRSLAQPD